MWPNGVLGLVFLALVILAWRKRRQTLRDRVQSPPLELDDRAVKRILDEGRLQTPEDAPLDLEEIEDEERRFWQEEGWDEAERM